MKNPKQQVEEMMQESLDEFKQTRIFKWFDYMLGSKYGLYVLPIIVMVDVYLLILPLEPILAAYAIKHKKTSLHTITFVSVFVSLFGYISLYLVGQSVSGGAREFLGGIFGEEGITRAGELFAQDWTIAGITIGISALLALASALASVPIPLSVLTFSAGVFSIPLLPFAVMFTIGRYARYYLSAWLGRKYGVAALESVFKNIYVFTGLFLVSATIILFKIF